MDSFSQFFNQEEEQIKSLFANKRRRLSLDRQARYKEKRNLTPPEEVVQWIVAALNKFGPLTRYKLTSKVNLFGDAFEAGINLAIESGLVDAVKRSAHPNGGGPKTIVYSLRN